MHSVWENYKCVVQKIFQNTQIRTLIQNDFKKVQFFTIYWLSDDIRTFSPNTLKSFRHEIGRLDTTLSTLVNESSRSSTADTNDKGFNPLPVIYVTLLFGVAAAFVFWMNRRKLKKCSGFQGGKMSLLPQLLVDFSLKRQKLSNRNH